MIFSGLKIADRAWFAANAVAFVLQDADLGYLVDLPPSRRSLSLTT